MSDVIEFPGTNKPPTAQGEALCLACHHEFVAIVPVGTIALTCPECKTLRGVFRYHFMPPPSKDLWLCNNCESHAFSVTRDVNNGDVALSCLGCGVPAKW